MAGMSNILNINGDVLLKTMQRWPQPQPKSRLHVRFVISQNQWRRHGGQGDLLASPKSQKTAKFSKKNYTKLVGYRVLPSLNQPS